MGTTWGAWTLVSRFDCKEFYHPSNQLSRYDYLGGLHGSRFTPWLYLSALALRIFSSILLWTLLGAGCTKMLVAGTQLPRLKGQQV